MLLQRKHTDGSCSYDRHPVNLNHSASMPLATQPCCLPLHDAIKSGDVELAVRLIASGSANQVDARGNTPLHIAAVLLSPQIVKALLGRGADPSALNRDSETPLHVAIHAVGNRADLCAGFGIIGALLKAGSKPNPRNLKLETPLHLVRHYQMVFDHEVEMRSMLQYVESMLIRYGARPEMVRPRLPHEW